MADSTLGVGDHRRQPERGWAATAYIPALRALPGCEIRALSVRSQESARAAGAAFGVEAVFSDHERLVSKPDVDMVAVTVKVPHHRELVSAALTAGKAVYCEWPLGRDVADARAMLRRPPNTGCARLWGCRRVKLRSWNSFGNCLWTDTPVGHCVDMLNYVLGEFADLSALSDLRRPLITIAETGGKIAKTAADQVAIIGTLTSGANASIHIREAVSGGTGLMWEIKGTDGTLRITAGAAYPEIYPLTVAEAHGPDESAELDVLARLTQKWTAFTGLAGGSAYNVGCVYAAFAADVSDGTYTVPDITDAVLRQEVIATIEQSALSGERLKVWRTVDHTPVRRRVLTAAPVL